MARSGRVPIIESELWQFTPRTCCTTTAEFFNSHYIYTELFSLLSYLSLLRWCELIYQRQIPGIGVNPGRVSPLLKVARRVSKIVEALRDEGLSFEKIKPQLEHVRKVSGSFDAKWLRDD